MAFDSVFITALIASLIVAAILVFGIATFGRGGDFNKRNANKIMRWRIAAQFAAIVVVFAVLYWRTKG